MNFLEREEVGLLVVDVQERLLPTVDHPRECVKGVALLIQAANLLGIPVVVTEQYPEGLGPTVGALKGLLKSTAQIFSKKSFSALGEPEVKKALEAKTQWLVCGLEAHVCVQQTVKALVAEGKEVTVINDAISSQSVIHLSTAIAEMMRFTRITSGAAAIFELLKSSEAPEFKACQALVIEQTQEPPACCSLG